MILMIFGLTQRMLIPNILMDIKNHTPKTKVVQGNICYDNHSNFGDCNYGLYHNGITPD